MYKTTTQLPRETVILETAYTEDYAEQFQYLPISFDGKTADGKQLGCSQPQCLRWRLKVTYGIEEIVINHINKGKGEKSYVGNRNMQTRSENTSVETLAW